MVTHPWLASPFGLRCAVESSCLGSEINVWLPQAPMTNHPWLGQKPTHIPHPSLANWTLNHPTPFHSSSNTKYPYPTAGRCCRWQFASGARDICWHIGTGTRWRWHAINLAARLAFGSDRIESDRFGTEQSTRSVQLVIDGVWEGVTWMWVWLWTASLC